MAQIASILLPIFAVVALGAVLRRTRFVPEQFFRDTNRLVYWVAMPAFLFQKSADAQVQGDSALRVILAVGGGMVISIAVAYLLAAIVKAPRASTSALVQGSYRGNMAYVGLPVVLLALAADGHLSPETEAVTVLAVAGMTPLYNLVAVSVLVGGQTGTKHLAQRARELLLRLLTNPLLLSCVAGLAVMALGWELPEPLRETLRLAGQVATPLALLGIGAALTFRDLRAHWSLASIAAAIKLIVSPLAGMALAGPLRLTAIELQMALLFLATPTAAASYIMAQQLGADERLAANVIVLTTFLSLPALGLVLALVPQ